MSPSQSTQGLRQDNLALIFQELLTVIIRLRSNPKDRAVNDSESFRNHVLSTLASAKDQALRRGYEEKDVNATIFAIVAFLDETVLNSQNPVFADWPRKPLQEQMFHVHEAGELYFRNIQLLLARSDSGQLEEVLEVYQLCILLGFRGRYSSSSGELRAIAESIAAKRRRIRAVSQAFSPNWQPSSAPPPVQTDPWVGRLARIAAGSVGFAVVLMLVYLFLLSGADSELQTIMAQHRL